MSVHGTPVNNVLNPPARSSAAILRGPRPAFFAYAACAKAYTHAGPNSRFRSKAESKREREREREREGGRGRGGFSAVRDIYFTSILIASVGRQDDCGGPDVPSRVRRYTAR